MTLFQDTGGDPRAAAAQFADVLALYGAIGDAVCGNPLGFARKKAATAVSLAQSAQTEPALCNAVYFAGMLHAIGAIGNASFRKGERLSERLARMESWDVPAQGARFCQELEALPPATADLVRWQAECWDGTGYPDQLRWHGIPPCAMLLALADAYARAPETEDILPAVAMQSGRAYGPEIARTFTMWFHMSGGEVDAVEPPLDALTGVDDRQIGALLDTIADRVDAHNGVEGRWRRIARLAEQTADIMALDAPAKRALGLAVRLYGTGETGERELSEISFDPLARLGIDERTAHALAAAALLEGNATLAAAAPVLRARGEWFDGTGKPDGLLHKALPTAAAILAAAIAYDQLGHKDRIDTAAGTQFDPQVVRAILEAARAIA